MLEEIQDIPAQEQTMNKNHITLLIEGIILCITGLILVIAPKTGLGLMSAGLGLLIALDGFRRTITTFKANKAPLSRKIISIVELATGIVVLCFSFIIGKSLGTVLIFILGIILIAIAILRFVEFIRAYTQGEGFPLYALSTLGLGIVLIMIPQVASQLILRLIGLIPVFAGVVFIRLAFIQRDKIIK